ncbi:hypothetical protein CIRG_08469 [Coccidioides immitis RMSCC 2394]|uniref:Uncharacterized protein n=1 Tax=Coccidioides immitis RMSCC 2394 TaxID=404692 RepID=A0A0J6YNN8_COCIT|nr:hypothetical protein CIRG_08469 [Coccidioides immitis RMSCC 2394]
MKNGKNHPNPVKTWPSFYIKRRTSVEGKGKISPEDIPSRVCPFPLFPALQLRDGFQSPSLIASLTYGKKESPGPNEKPQTGPRGRECKKTQSATAGACVTPPRDQQLLVSSLAPLAESGGHLCGTRSSLSGSLDPAMGISLKRSLIFNHPVTREGRRRSAGLRCFGLMSDPNPRLPAEF